jgi:arabinan endo-1,5-alpha-L-arabinosidase
LRAYTDGFSGSALSKRWTWIRPPAATKAFVRGGRFVFRTQAADLNQGTDPAKAPPLASVLTERAPTGDFIAQAKVSIDLPPSGCCYNFAQAGLVIYGSDDSYVKLAHASIFETRQTEFAIEVPTPPSASSHYGNTVVGPPGHFTWLRIVRRSPGVHQRFTAYTSDDGRHWVRGGTWQQDLLRGSRLRIGLVSMGIRPETPEVRATARFDEVRVWTLRP